MPSRMWASSHLAFSFCEETLYKQRLHEISWTVVSAPAVVMSSIAKTLVGFYAFLNLEPEPEF